ncbi:hypothetical protein BDV23DRAFT_195668 [Aspergillus alliaceus]|uniref:Uncharacterized protein n=1 Tax=Petromyces alliaceus TaxID=209559 RepID=A0A5N6FMK0_PETAA|nr:uncharacterized protein BDW43DRAFT_301984 [Aspergillus alliaceus]KAB8231088.1 hypothetical protein BDW43DRAFT_301984 [Aspergillus alliaceus]KAE8387609.1 hypothetical protein BDV23DRAFT_195668 [Aspergillus alliaceus]
MSSSNADGDSYVQVTPDDHSAFIIIAALVGLSWSIFIIGIRVYLRWKLNPPFGFDDAFAVFGTIIGTVQTAVTLDAVRSGIGKKEALLTDDRVESGLKSIYIAWLLYPVVVCSSKISISLLIARLTRTKLHLKASHLLTGFIVLWGVISLFLIAFQCKLPMPWDIGAMDHCRSMFVQWTAVEAGNIFIELLLPCIVILMVWDLRVASTTKITVVMAFSLQLLATVPIVVRLVLLQQSTTGDDAADPTFTITDTVLVTEVAMHFSLMSATFPCLRKFLQVFDMNMGATTHLDCEPGGTYYSRSRSGGSYALQSIEQGSRVGREDMSGTKSRFLTKGQGQTVTTVSGGLTEGADHQGKSQRNSTMDDAEMRSIDSDGSQHAIIRRTQWEVKVE